jgi:hypothetical protein
MAQKPMPCSLLKLGGNDRETGHSGTEGSVSQSLAALREPYTPRTGRAGTRRQDRGVCRV